MTPTAKNSVTRESCFTGPGKGAFSLLLSLEQAKKVRETILFVIINFIDEEGIRLFFRGEYFDTNRIQNNSKRLYPGNHFEFYPVEVQDF